MNLNTFISSTKCIYLNKEKKKKEIEQINFNIKNILISLMLNLFQLLLLRNKNNSASCRKQLC